MIKLKDVTKKVEDRYILDIDFLEFSSCGFDIILGESGAGKSTLLGVIGTMEMNYEGEVYYNNTKSEKNNNVELRKEQISFIFQDLNLLEGLTVKENIELALEIANIKWNDNKYKETLERLGVLQFSETQVKKLSGGEKQRVAIARALLKESKVILADEPTGNLDRENAANIFRILKEIGKERKIILVTHDREFAYEYADRIIIMNYGKIEKIIEQNSISEQDNQIEEVFVSEKKRNNWVLRYAWREFIHKRKKNISISVTLIVLLACIDIILGMCNSVNGMYNNLNTTVLENDKYQIMNDVIEKDICYYPIDKEFQQKLTKKDYVAKTITYYEANLYTETQKGKFNIKYSVVDDSEFLKKRYRAGKEYIGEDNDIILNEYLANQIWGSTDVIGKKLKIGEILSGYSEECKVIGIRNEGIESEVGRAYISDSLLHRIAKNKLNGNLFMSWDQTIESEAFCNIYKLQKAEELIYGKKIKDSKNEILISASSAANYLEGLGYQCSIKTVKKGKMSKQLQNKIIGREVIIYSSLNVYSTVTIVGITENTGLDVVDFYAHEELIENMKQLTDYRTEVYLNNIKEKTINDLENLCKQYGYSINKANGASINVIMSRIVVIVFAFSILGVILCIATFFIVHSVTKLDIITRSYEIGVLKTLGSSNKEIFKLLIIQNFLLGIFSSAIIVLISIILEIGKIDKYIQIAGYQIYHGSVGQSIIIMLAGVLFSVISGILPIMKASRLDVKTALKGD